MPLFTLGIDVSHLDIATPEISTATAKVFWSGRSQAVRLPKAFRFDTTEVRIRKNGNQRQAENLSRLDELQFDVLDFNAEDARQAGEIRIALARR